MSTTQNDDTTISTPAPAAPTATADAPAPGAPASAEGAPPPEDSLPCISIRCKRLPEAVSSAIAAMIGRNDPPVIFNHDGQVVKLALREGERPQIIPLRPVDLQRELAYAARWSEESDKGAKPIYPPSLVVNAVSARMEEWAPPLRRVVGIPTFKADWQLQLVQGYQAQDQSFYQPDHATLPSVAPRPAAHEVTEAVRVLLDELLGDFPFVGEADRAAALACLILPFVRNRIDGATPLHLIESPTPGSGKTLLADALCVPALGRAPAATTEIANADDLRKSITALALADEPVILIDNINARLQGSALAAALTKVEWADRVIGTSRLARGAMKAVWLGTGNNVLMTAEVARRVVRCRIDAGVPQPHLRTGFQHADLRGWAKENRARLIWAGLTLVQNWVAVGRPQGPIVLGSFESYCRIVGGILAAAHVPGFLSNVHADRHHADDETAEWEAFVAEWSRSLGEHTVGADALDTRILARNPEMLSVTLAATGSERGRRIKLGQELRKRRDAVIGGFRLKVSDRPDRHGCWRYHLETISCATYPPTEHGSQHEAAEDVD